MFDLFHLRRLRVLLRRVFTFAARKHVLKPQTLRPKQTNRQTDKQTKTERIEESKKPRKETKKHRKKRRKHGKKRRNKETKKQNETKPTNQPTIHSIHSPRSAEKSPAEGSELPPSWLKLEDHPRTKGVYHPTRAQTVVYWIYWGWNPTTL